MFVVWKDVRLHVAAGGRGAFATGQHHEDLGFAEVLASRVGI
jgi:hypothetical protein